MTQNELVDQALRGGENLNQISKRMGINYSTLKSMTGRAKADKVSRAFDAFQSIPGAK